MDIEKAKHLKWLEETVPQALPHALGCLGNKKTMVDTGAHTGYSITIDRRSGGERRSDG